MFSFIGLNKAQVILSSLLFFIIFVLGRTKFLYMHVTLTWDGMKMLDWVEGTHNSPTLTRHDVVVFLDGLELSDLT
jgi:hypothetical protein